MPSNGEHDNDVTVSESAGSRIRRLAAVQRRFVEHLEETADFVDSLEGAARAHAVRELSEWAGDLGDSYHDLRRGLARL
jgi:hypothetical protein